MFADEGGAEHVGPVSFCDPAGVVNVLMNCQWQSLACRVEAGVLNMFAEEEEGAKRERSPQYTVQLRGCEVRAGPDTERSHRITLSVLGDPLAVLEVRAPLAPFAGPPLWPGCHSSSRPSGRQLRGEGAMGEDAAGRSCRPRLP